MVFLGVDEERTGVGLECIYSCMDDRLDGVCEEILLSIYFMYEQLLNNV